MKKALFKIVSAILACFLVLTTLPAIGIYARSANPSKFSDRTQLERMIISQLYSSKLSQTDAAKVYAMLTYLMNQYQPSSVNTTESYCPGYTAKSKGYTWSGYSHPLSGTTGRYNEGKNPGDCYGYASWVGYLLTGIKQPYQEFSYNSSATYVTGTGKNVKSYNRSPWKVNGHKKYYGTTSIVKGFLIDKENISAAGYASSSFQSHDGALYFSDINWSKIIPGTHVRLKYVSKNGEIHCHSIIFLAYNDNKLYYTDCNACGENQIQFACLNLKDNNALKSYNQIIYLAEMNPSNILSGWENFNAYNYYIAFTSPSAWDTGGHQVDTRISHENRIAN